MEETTNTNPNPNTTPPVNVNAGKGMGIAGFVISLVALVIYFIVAPIAGLSALAGGGMGISIFWVILSAVGLVLSIMGFTKAKAVNGKKGLAIAGLVIGIIATILSVRLVFAVKTIHDTAGDFGKELINAMGEGMKEGLQQAMDSVNKELDKVPADSTAH